MPECCHQPPPTVDLSQALAVTTSHSVEESEHLDLVEGSGHDVAHVDFGGNSVDGSDGALEVELFQRLPESGRPKTTDAEDTTESNCNSNCAVLLYNANSCTNDDGSGHNVKTMKSKGEDGTGGIENHNICGERDDALARAHSSGEEQQCISIRSDNGPPLSASAGEQSGEHPKPQETMESHIDGHIAPEPSKNTLTQPLSAELETQTDLPDVEQDKTSTTGHVGSMVNLPAAAMDCSINPKENNDSMTNANKTGELIVSVERDKGVSEQRKSDAADELRGLKDSSTQSNTPHTPNETVASHLRSQEHHGLKAPAEKDLCDSTMPVVLVHGCEIPHQTALEQQNVEMAAVNQAKRGEWSGAGNVVREAEVTFETPSTDMCAKAQHCAEDMDCHLTPEKVDVAESKTDKRHAPTNNHCINQATEDDVSRHTASKDVTSSSEVQTQAYMVPPDSGCLKLDTIPEVSASEADDNAVTQNNTAATVVHAPAGPLTHTVHENTTTQRQPGCSAEVSDELSPEGLHDNQSSGRYVGESPASEVADGQRGHRRPQATGSEMEDMVEVAAQAGSTQLPSTALDGRREPAGEQKEDSTVKMRMRKTSRDEREHSHLDSMVLLLMKLDQLDQEIENALSTTSSMDSTPTLRRRQLMEMELGSVPGTGSSEGTNPPSHHDGSAPITITTGSASVMGAKPKSGSNSTFADKEKAEIEAKEACTWLRAAGFPQYAQLYEDALFPIDIASVTRDHDFLDRDAIEALCRRLNTLNKCALMRLEISPQRKRSEDSDEDEPCAISGRWTFQRDSKRWSRMEELEVFSSLPAGASQSSFPQDQVSPTGTLTLREGHSSESVLSDLSEQPEVGSIHSSGSGGREDEKNHAGALATQALPTGATRASSVASMCSSSGTGGSGCAIEDSLSDGLPPSPLETLGQFTFDVKAGMGGACLERGFGDGGKSTRSRAKSFLKRMESLNLWSGTSTKRKKKLTISGGKLEISGPVIKEGLDDNKLRRLNCVDISSIALDHNLNHRNPAQTMTLNRNRSVSYSTQTSSGSTGSSQSEASSGSTVSTPSPVTRARSHSTAAGSTKRGGMYLEGFDPFSSALQQQASNQQPATPEPKSAPPAPCQAGRRTTVDEQNRRNNHGDRNDNRQVPEEDEEEEEEEEDGVIFFYLPEGHKPGTFPKALQDGSARNGNDNGNSVVLRGRQSRRQRRCSVGSADSRLSFYDNVPYAEREEEEDEERKLDQVLQHVSGMQRFVNAWSAAVAREDEEEEDEEEEEEEECDSDSALDSASPCPSSPLQNRLEETENGSDQDSTGNPLGEGDDGMRERRDSGVGASLTRTNRPQKLRWPSFQSSHRPSLASAQLQIGCQSVLQMNLLQKLSLLQLTALLEKHTPTNKHGFSWAVPKFMKRIKVRDYKDRNVFGVPLQVNVQRTGQPLPQGIQQAMRYLRNQCLDQVGLFRKSGVKSRIQALRQMNEACGADGGGVNYEGQSAYDVADMLKQYFRDLPEPLLTSKLSETFLQIYQYMPKELRLQAARSAVLLLPDENREALRTLLCLLSDVTASVAENQMTPTNLAVCLAPSLFHLNTLRRKESSSPRVMNRKQTLGKPDQRDLNENLAATHGLTHMIQECRKLFKIPEEMSRCRNSYVEQALLPVRLEELGGEEAGPGGYRSYLRDSLDALLKESKDKFKGYDSCSTPEHAELAYRKVNDGSPLRLWKVTVEVPASPEEVLTRVLREQAHWDEDLLESRVAETLDERTEVYQYVRNAMAPHPTRDHVVLRTWLTDLPKGACALVCTSVEHAGAPVLGVRANVLTSRYFIEPCGTNKSRLTHISRTDCRGRFPEWYNKLYGHLCAAEVVRIRDSFTVSMEK